MTMIPQLCTTHHDRYCRPTVSLGLMARLRVTITHHRRATSQAAGRFRMMPRSYRLGAEYAHLDLFDAAVAQMVHALACDSGQHCPLSSRGCCRSCAATLLSAGQLGPSMRCRGHTPCALQEAFENPPKTASDPARTLLERGLEAAGYLRWTARCADC